MGNSFSIKRNRWVPASFVNAKTEAFLPLPCTPSLFFQRAKKGCTWNNTSAEKVKQSRCNSYAKVDLKYKFKLINKRKTEGNAIVLKKKKRLKTKNKKQIRYHSMYKIGFYSSLPDILHFHYLYNDFCPKHSLPVENHHTFSRNSLWKVLRDSQDSMSSQCFLHDLSHSSISAPSITCSDQEKGICCLHMETENQLMKTAKTMSCPIHFFHMLHSLDYCNITCIV